MSRPIPALSAPLVFRIVLVLFLIVYVLISSANAQQVQRTYPNATYYSAFGPYQDGDFKTARKAFESAFRSGVLTVDGRWIDSICYYTMLGECHYQIGDYKTALTNYNAALNLYLVYSRWLQDIQFPGTIAGAAPNRRLQPTWGPSQRTAPVARLPRSMPMFRGRLNNQSVIENGGVIQVPEFVLVSPQEIVRTTCLAMRRRHELLGPIAGKDALTTRLLDTVSGRIGPVNHWSQAWVNAMRGIAQAAAGRDDEAFKTLQAAQLLSGQFDHPLTGMVLLEMGHIAARQKKLERAADLYFESTFPAARHEQPSLIEEALRRASAIQIAMHRAELFSPLVPASQWAHRQRYAFAKSSLLLAAADNAIAVNQPDTAGGFLSEAQKSLKRRAAGNPKLGARFQFATAQLASRPASGRHGQASRMRVALDAAIGFQRTASLRLFQLSTVDELAFAGAVTDRNLLPIYEKLLADPNSEDWLLDPLDAITFLSTFRPRSYETWVDVALAREDVAAAIEAGDQLRRHRFHVSLPMGGRLLSLRWLVAAPTHALDDTARVRRDDLLTRYPELQGLGQESDGLIKRLREIPRGSTEKKDIQRLAKIIAALEDVSNKQEAILERIAIHREYCPLLFPPQRSVKDIQANLAEDELALLFLTGSTSASAFMLSRDKEAQWRLPSPKRLEGGLAKTLRAMGHLDDNGSLKRQLLENPLWRSLSPILLEQLIDPQQRGFWNRFQRMVIVPDGFTWFVPFESLLIKEGDDVFPLISKMAIRYAPTAGLMLPDGRPDRAPTSTQVLLGRLHPGDDEEFGPAQVDDWQRFVEGIEVLPNKWTGATGIMRTTWEQVVVFDDMPNRRHKAFDWSPAKLHLPHGEELSDWIRLPWGGPDRLVLPGFHTAAEQGLKGTDDGKQIFLGMTGLMATGARTILVSRWRIGGQSSYDLMREYLQESAGTAPDQAWQRAVEVFRRGEIDPDLEPRVAIDDDQPVSADHPFFWGGYMVLDRGAGIDRPAIPDQEATVKE